MFNISDCNFISLTRGNSAVIQITPTDSNTGDPIILSDTDRVIFTIKNRRNVTVFQKILTANDYEEGSTALSCYMDPDDTIDLPTGEYKYDCLFVTDDKQAVTFIQSIFVLTDAYGVYTDAGGALDG